MLTLLKAVKSQVEESGNRHELDVDEVEIEEFYNCVVWSVGEVDFIAMNGFERVVGSTGNYSHFVVQKLIELTQPQQLKLSLKYP